MTLADDLIAAPRLRAVTAHPYLATALFAMRPRVTPGLGTFGVDRRWNLYVDPVCFDQWTTDEAAAVLVHEAHHLLRDHATRAAALQVPLGGALRWNVAADCEINDDLGDLQLPGDACTPARFGLADGELAEWYYAALEPDSERWDCGSGAGGPARRWEDTSDPGIDVHEADLIRRQVATAVAQSARRGQELPVGLERWADRVLHPKVDWRTLLSAALRGSLGLVRGQVDYSYGRPSRRQAPRSAGGRAVLPAMVAPVPRVAVVVDTSGSMSGRHLGQALAEVAGLLRSVGTSQHLVVLSCDSAVRTTQRVLGTADVRLHGGGGTDLRVGLEAASQLQPSPDVVVVLTDGATPWPDEPPALKRVVVVLLGTDLPMPAWGAAVHVPLEDLDRIA